MNSVFDGAVRVGCVKAKIAALNCICYIERVRNEDFEEDIQEIMEWEFGLLDILFNDNICIGIKDWFNGKRNFTRDESIKYIHKTRTVRLNYSDDYIHAEKMVWLADASINYVYLNPLQSWIYNTFKDYDPKDHKDFNIRRIK